MRIYLMRISPPSPLQLSGSAALKTQPLGVDGRGNTEQNRSGCRSTTHIQPAESLSQTQNVHKQVNLLKFKSSKSLV